MRKEVISKCILALLLLLPSLTASAAAGFVDRWTDYLFILTDMALFITLIYIALGGWRLHIWPYRKRWQRVVEWVFCMAWFVVLGELSYGLLPLLCPIIFWVALRLMRGRPSAPDKSQPWYKRTGLAIYNNNIVRALALFAAMIILVSGYDKLVDFVFDGDPVHIHHPLFDGYESVYRHIRDVVYNAVSFDINYIIGLIALYAMFLMVMWVVYKRKERLNAMSGKP